MILKIIRLLERNWFVIVEHVYHEANGAADSMASMGYVLTLGLHVFCDPAKGLRGAFSDNYRKVALPYLIAQFPFVF